MRIRDRQAILDAVARTVESYAPELIAVYVFGSVGRGDGRESSDVDIGVLRQRGAAAGAPFGGLPLDLEGELERVLGREVQVVALEAAPPDFVHDVLRDGVVVVDHDRAARIRFEVQARNGVIRPLADAAALSTPRCGAMTDDALIEKKLAFVETCVAAIRAQAPVAGPSSST